MRELEYSGTLKVADNIRQMSRRGFEIINFAGGTLDDTPLVVKEATKAAIDEGLGSGLTDSAGLYELRQAIANKLAIEYDIHVDPRSQIIVTVGAKNAILEALQATVEPGEEVLIIEPFWPSYKSLVNLAGGIPKLVPMRKDRYFELDKNNIRREIGPKSKMIILNTPHNPTGRVFTKNEIEAICDIAKEFDLIVLSDECYREIVYEGNKHCSPASFPGMDMRTITVYSFAKAYTMYGWRVGFAAANEEIVSKMVMIQSNSVSCPTSFAQKGAVAALREGEKHIHRVIKTYQKLRDITVNKLNEIESVSCETPEGGFWVFPDVSKITGSSERLVEYLLEKGRIATTAGFAFGDCASRHLRISYRHEEPYLRKGLEHLMAALKTYINKEKSKDFPF
jgi:aspartate/methionine/tyrosine aminotransferase